MPDSRDLRVLIVAALTAAAYQCDGDCGLPEHECFNSHPITWSGMAAGRTHITGSAADIADIALAAIQGAYVPPPPGDDRAALPDHLLAAIAPHTVPYVSSYEQIADACAAAGWETTDSALRAELLEWAARMRASCRQTRKQDMAPCGHPKHRRQPSTPAGPGSEETP